MVALLVGRADMYNTVPYPVILPLAGIAVKCVALMATYIPNLSSSGGGNGNMLFLFGRNNLGS